MRSFRWAYTRNRSLQASRPVIAIAYTPSQLSSTHSSSGWAPAGSTCTLNWRANVLYPRKQQIRAPLSAPTALPQRCLHRRVAAVAAAGSQPGMQVVVVGGGIIGAATAHYLAAKGARPLVVEACSPACSASGKAGVVGQRRWGAKQGCMQH